MKRQRQEKKRGFLSISYLLIVLMIAAFTACGGGGSGDGGSSNNNPNPTPAPATGTISGSVSGTIIVAVNDNGDIVASDDTTGKTADSNGNFPFTLTGIPTGVNIRVYLITSTGVYPMYFDSNNDGTADTNVFSLSSAAAIDLGYVAITNQQAIPTTNPITTQGVSAGAENTNTPNYLVSGTFYTSSGTYTYTNGILSANTTSTNTICNTTGVENYTVTTLTATTMIMVDSNADTLTWTRPSGTDGDPVGTWTMTIFNYLWVAKINADGTFTVSENFKCVKADSLHTQFQGTDYYSAWVSVNDPTQQFTPVTVEGQYISGSLSLTYNSSEGYWEGSIFLGPTPPTNLPLTYTFTLNSNTGTITMTDDIEAFVVPLATNLSPSGGQTVSATPTFTWTGTGSGTGSGYTYMVSVFESNCTSPCYGIWNSNLLTTTSVGYSGPALTSSGAYFYDVLIIDAYGNASIAEESFVVQ
ncbi:MAG: hypothetical protein AABY39_03820 [Nitrospirota bacterium]